MIKSKRYNIWPKQQSPAHTEVARNEAADKMVRAGTKLQQT